MGEVMLQSLELFSKEPALLSVQKYTFERIPTKSQLDDPNLAQFEISAPMSRENYTDLHNSFLYLRVKITHADGSDIDAAPKVGPVQYPIGSLIKSVEVQLNNTRVTPLDDEYGYVAFLTNLFKPAESKKGYLTAGLWYSDTASMTAIQNPNPQAANNLNAGLKARASYFASSSEVELIGRVHAAPHSTPRLYPCFCAFDWKFSLNAQKFFLMTNETPGTTDYVLKITAADMFVKRVEVNPAIRLAHTELLQKRNFHYPIHYVASRPRNIPTGSSDFNWPGIFSGGDIPNSVVVIFVATDAKNGHLKKNPFYLQNMNIESLELSLGNRIIPSSNYNSNMGTNRSLLNYWQTVTGLGYHWGSDVFAGNFSRVNFQNVFFVSVFDLTRDENPRGNYINTSFVTEQLNLSGKFRAATTESFTCLAFGHFQSAMEIDSSYRPICSW